MKTFKSIFLFVIYFSFLTLLNAETDEEFLRNIQKKSFDFFWYEVSSSSGVVKDKAINKIYEEDGSTKGSIASTGFGLGVICIGHSQGWITYDQAYERILATLNFFKDKASRKNGFYAHFIDIETGMNEGSELSSIDTALLMAGALFAGQYFRGTEIETLSYQLYESVNWTWMCNTNQFVNHGWSPSGFISYEWNQYDECVILYILAYGSPTYLPYDSPNGWKNLSKAERTVGPYTFIYTAPVNPLFTHQFPQCWVDLRYQSWNSTNFFTNSVKITLANKWFCENAGWGSDYWGLTACHAPAPTNYKAYGIGPTTIETDHTVSVYGSGASVMFTPQESISALRFLYDNYKDQLWGKYGFSDALNTGVNWYDDYVIGIDQGSMVLSIENYLTGMIWDEFMKIIYVQNSLDIMGFSPDSDVTRPDKITDFGVFGNNLEWTAPKDDQGTVIRYIIKYLTRPITKPADWYEAEELSQTLVPKTPGSKESLMVDNIPPGTYYFAIKSVDDKGNKSWLSNSTVSAVINSIRNSLLSGFPNPFNLNQNSTITYRYVIEKQSKVILQMATLNGKIIKEWNRGTESAGYHQFDWDGKDDSGNMIQPGIYILLLKVDNDIIDENTMVVVK